LADTSEESALLARLSAHESGPDRLPVVDERILRALEADVVRAPERSLWQKLTAPMLSSRPARLAASLGLGAIVLALTSFSGLDHAELPALLTALAGGLGLSWLFLPPAVPGPARATRTSRWVLGGVVLALTVAYVTMTIAEFDPLSIVLAEVPWQRVVACGLHVALAGGLCLVAFIWPWQKSDPFSPGLLGALLGALAGYAGMLAVDATCASTEGFHVILGHASAVVAFAAVGALVGRRWLSP